jgi:hypothetical protein
MSTFTNIELYGPCPCGSGKKLRFCCRDTLSQRAQQVEAEREACGLAIGLAEKGRFDAAAAAVRPFAATSLVPETFMTLATAELVRGQIVEAISFARQATLVDPNAAAPLGLLAHLLIIDGDHDGAGVVLDGLSDHVVADDVVVAVDDAYHVVPPLLLLGRFSDVLAVMKTYPSHHIEPMLYAAAAVAAVHVGALDDAARWVGPLGHNDATSLLRRFVQGDKSLILGGGLATAPLPIGLLYPRGTLLALMERIDTFGPQHRGISEIHACAFQQLMAIIVNRPPISLEECAGVAGDLELLHPSVRRPAQLAIVEDDRLPLTVRSYFMEADGAVRSSAVEALPPLDIDLPLNIAKRLKKPLGTDTLADLYAGLTVVELREVIESFGYDPEKGAKKAALVDHVSALANDAVDVVDLAHALVEDGYGTAVHRFARDGRISFADAATALVDEGADFVDSSLAAVIDVGLVVIGTVDGYATALMPEPIQRALRDAGFGNDDNDDDDDIDDGDDGDDDDDDVYDIDGDGGVDGGWAVGVRGLPSTGIAMVIIVQDVATGKLLALRPLFDDLGIEIAAVLKLAEVEGGGPPKRVFVEKYPSGTIRAPVLQEVNDATRDAFPGTTVVGVSPFPSFDDIAEGLGATLQEKLHREKPWAKGLGGRGISPGLVQEAFAVAADYYRAHPWLVIPDDTCGIVVDFPRCGLSKAVIMVIGQGNHHFGCVVFPSLQDWERLKGAASHIAPDEESPPPCRVIDFDWKSRMTPAQNEELKNQKLPIAAPRAYPSFSFFGHNGERMGDDSDVSALVGAMRVVVSLITTSRKQLKGWHRRPPDPQRLRVGDDDVDVSFITSGRALERQRR